MVKNETGIEVVVPNLKNNIVGIRFQLIYFNNVPITHLVITGYIYYKKLI
jgi:hypothetical protein